jgi:hypothetical protein
VAGVHAERQRLVAEYQSLQPNGAMSRARSYEVAVQVDALLHEEIALALRWVCLIQEQLALQKDHHTVLTEFTRLCLPRNA